MASERAAEGDRRYRPLETTRDYAGILLADAGELEEVGRRHAHHFVNWIADVRRSMHRPEVFRRLHEERDHVRVALAQAWSSDDCDTLFRLVAPLWFYWWLQGSLSEARHWLDRALILVDGAPPDLQAEVLAAGGRHAARRGELEQAQALLERALELQRRARDPQALIATLDWLGNVPRDRAIGTTRAAFTAIA